MYTRQIAILDDGRAYEGELATPLVILHDADADRVVAAMGRFLAERGR